MNRCIELAKNGLGSTYPNPLVGSVIVYDNRIIGEGWHRKAGEAHAEVHAIQSVKDKTILAKATIYVSLEPCSHFGKTPPCSDLIIAHKIPNVVIGTVDPFAKVAGNGIKRLLENNINVTVGILEEKCKELNRRFFIFHNKKRPFIILKWAESQDGFIAPDKNLRATAHEKLSPVWITNPYSRQLVHKWRTEEQAILVGTNTVLEDNPKLDARDFDGNHPIRIVIDKSNQISDIFSVKNGKTLSYFFTENDILTKKENIIYENIVFNTDFLLILTNRLHKYKIQIVVIEGGEKTLQSFIDMNLWDEARVFVGKTELHSGIKAPILESVSNKTISIMDDTLKFFRNYD